MLDWGARFDRHFGPYEFWNGIRDLFAQAKPRPFLTWEEWDAFFALAQRYDMVDFMPDAKGSVARFKYGKISLALLNMWRRVRNAKAAGMTPRSFHLSEALEDAERKETERVMSLKQPAQVVRAKYRARETDA